MNPEKNKVKIESVGPRKLKRVVVVGHGGREHALIRALGASVQTPQIFAVPGLKGFEPQAECCHADLSNLDQTVAVILKLNPDLVIVGPEAPLAMGLSDVLRENKILVFGPSGAAAQLEANKVLAKKFMLSYGVQTAPATEVRSVADAIKHAEGFSAPYVFKVSGLAAGKGVFICKDKTELLRAVELTFDKKIFGQAGESALLEKFMKGRELSLLVLTNGRDFEILPLAQDHKRLLDNDEGPNTGGMGTVAPMTLSIETRDLLIKKIIEPSLKGLQKEKLLFRGVLFIGVMMVEGEPYALEYNVRFGDPETQVILPLLKEDWLEVLESVARGEINKLQWSEQYATCVVLASKSYPESGGKGLPLKLEVEASPSQYFLHAGTAWDETTGWMVNGGRVINCIGLGISAAESKTKAYELVKEISQSNQLQYRSDIGQNFQDKIT